MVNPPEEVHWSVRSCLICLSVSTDEEGPEGLTQFLLLEVRKLREQLKNSRLCERRLTQQCRAAEEERTCAERKAQELLRDKQQVQRCVTKFSFTDVRWFLFLHSSI